MKPAQSVAPITQVSHSEEIDEREALLLEQAVEKLVRFGQQVGVSPEEMISLFDSGIRVRDLLVFLASKTSSGVA
jgi:hypothetical protein